MLNKYFLYVFIFVVYIFFVYFFSTGIPGSKLCALSVLISGPAIYFPAPHPSNRLLPNRPFRFSSSNPVLNLICHHGVFYFSAVVTVVSVLICYYHWVYFGCSGHTLYMHHQGSNNVSIFLIFVGNFLCVLSCAIYVDDLREDGKMERNKIIRVPSFRLFN